MDLKNNIFEKNIAVFGGAGIFFRNMLLNESPYLFNIFKGNKAFFADDFYTFPVKINFQDDLNFKSWANKSKYTIKMIPGFTKINLKFTVVDYYGQTLKSLSRFRLKNFS